MQNPVVTITMEDGSVIKAELYPEIAPNTVNNFISLINKKFYDGSRVVTRTDVEQADLVTPSRASSQLTVSRTT